MNFSEISKSISEVFKKSIDMPKFGDNLRSNSIKNFSEADMPLNDIKEKGRPIENKIEGLRREDEVYNDLKNKYPESKGYTICSEVYLRNESGKIVKDSSTNEARRVDFAVLKDGKVVDLIEVTSKTADKTAQCAKESRIRDMGGNFIKDTFGNLIKIPSNIKTRIERRD